MFLTMNRSVSRFQWSSRSLRRFTAFSSSVCLKNGPLKEVALVSFVRKKYFLSSVFCNIRALFENSFR